MTTTLASEQARPGAVAHRVGAALLHAPTARFVGRRLLSSAVLLFVVSALTFVLASLIPGDPARQILGPQATPESYAALRQALGVDVPVYQQYWEWLRHAVTGDLGTSLFDAVPVTETIGRRLPVTLSLTIGTLLVSLVAGVALGVASAVRGGVVGRAVDAFALLGLAFPPFWIGALLLSWFAVGLGWFPTFGYVPFDESPGEWLRSLVLPVTALSAFGVSVIAKQTREAMLEALASDYVRMARASGVSQTSIVLRHALKNAAMRILTMVGLLAVTLLGGTVAVEIVFGMPGLGELAVTSTTRHDAPMLQGIVVCFTIVVIAINLLVDVCYTLVNPKVRTR
ncbi:ABC transporter permease [Conexibacter woesei]|uniref:Binding-protein-dependent transport systems inner membrane component n=1 Tax=Conexibacter woesei (strain DSM 14684 / CCUG 47730 / CIP 108061 / JCM 11494 / NBRC 100937 / ID131577) TaxID=469383 RepID=D3F377_CONWI|nr:ABC transporter permease [Conexibacter woesei]ADB50357.1 binding-protein-dependent transport systems inner membrane component [Conexibacter woesei DSM 14684]